MKRYIIDAIWKVENFIMWGGRSLAGRDKISSKAHGYTHLALMTNQLSIIITSAQRRSAAS